MVPPDWYDPEYPQLSLLPSLQDFKTMNIDPDAYMYWRGQSDAQTSSCRALVPLKNSCVDAEIVNIKGPLRIAEVIIEDIGDDLMEGVKTKSLKEVTKFTPPIYSHAPRRLKNQPQVKDTIKDSNGNYKIIVESYFDNTTLFGIKHNWTDDAWGIFHLMGLAIIDQSICKVTNSSQQFCKLEQTYVAKVTDAAVVPYMQLVCNAARAKYLGQWYKRGDIITLFVKHSMMPSVPDPALLTIMPSDESAIVPMLPKQKLQIITAEKDSVVVFEPGQSLKYSYGATMGGQAKNIGRYVKCDYLECVKPPECSEVVKIYNCNEITKTISIPEISHTVNGNKKFPIIYDPQGRVVIRNNNIDGFIVRSRQAFSLSINGDCPAKLEYKMTRPPFHETKVKIKEYHPIFILEADKRANVWQVKTG